MSDRRNNAATAVLLLAATVAAAGASAATPAGASTARQPVSLSPSPATHPAPAAWHLLERRCSKCHNSVDWAGGIAFDTMSPQGIGEDAETWEKAVNRLQGRLMPPPGQPQPSQQVIDQFLGWLQGALDRAGAAHPDPGSVGLHRLNRTEYGREVQALLGLDVDVKSLLPADVASDGFDDIAAVLRVSPTFLEQYIRAARTISRLAVGRASAKPSTTDYRADHNADQFEHIDGLPLGTRGGMLIEHYFPADGEYDFDIGDFDFFGGGYVTKIDLPHTIILTIDGVRVFEGSVGGARELQAVDQHQAAAAVRIEDRFRHIRVRVRAGRHRVGVAFIERSLAESDSPLEPIAELPEMERYPTIPGLEVSGPFHVTGVGDTESRRRIFICRPAGRAQERPCARRILAHLATLAFRRPLSAADVQPLMAFYDLGRQSGDFDAGIESGLTAILASTKFLYRAEPLPRGAKPGDIYPVDDLSLASRLSFFLWSEGPDSELIELAAGGHLHEPGELARQVHRMLADRRSQSLVTNFAFQWLGVDKLDGVEPTPMLYPRFDSDLRNGYREEMRLFLEAILRSRRSVLELLSSDETFLNERLAREYGVPNVQGAQFRRVRLENPARWGLLGKGAVLMATSYGNRTSPVLRGAWLLETLTGTPPTSPPPGVPTLKEAAPGQRTETVRERLERHRTNPSCNACHGILDPLGFALENFDVVGGWRTRDRDAGSPIDASGRLADGTLVNGPAQLRKALLRHPAQFVQTLTERLMTFALGRGLTYHDMPTVRAIVRASAAHGYTFESIVQGIVASPAFRLKEVPARPATPGAATKQAAAAGPIVPSMSRPMKFITRKHLSRRTVLRGAGASIALPLLDAMVPAGTALAKTAAAARPRLGFFYFPHGAVMERWTPTRLGRDFEMNYILEPLAPFHEQVTVISNLGNKPAESRAVHALVPATWLSCVHPREGVTPYMSVTVDQIAAQHIGQDTPYPSLEVATAQGRGTGSACERGFGCTYTSTLSFSTPSTPLPIESNPRNLFLRLFGQGDSAAERAFIARQTSSLLDMISGEAASLGRTLGPADRATLSDYLQSVREVERRVHNASHGDLSRVHLPEVPGATSQSFPEHLSLMFEIMALAYQGNLTRVQSFMIAAEVSEQTYDWIGVPDAFHAVSHHGNDPAKKARLSKIQRYHTEAFAKFVQRLAHMPDGDGSMLDHAILLYGSNMSNSNMHNQYPLPTAIVGGGCGRIRGGQHITFPERTPLANVHLTMLERAGVPVERVGDSTGTILEL